MDDVFKALADPTRRSLLDELFQQDGQTLSALEARVPMTRFGVMKHLRQLEKAGLVISKKQGREKLHYLNPVPIRLIHDRWVSKYAAPWAAALSGLKQELEGRTMEKPMEKIYEIYIKTTPEQLWHALTATEMRQKWNFGATVVSDWKKGSRIEGRGGESLIFEAEVLEINPPWKLVQKFQALWSEEVKAEGPSRITWEITQVRDSCRLLVTHSGLREGANEQLYGGWPMALSGIKTLLETGEVLTTPGSLLWLEGDASAMERIRKRGAAA
jgi:uncharacterized protein YndB with AHSA1/START domain